MSQDFSITTKALEGGIVVVHVSGYLDAHTFEEMDNTMIELFNKKCYKVAVVLKDVPYISSAGAGVFIGHVGTAQDNRGNIILVNPSDNVKEVFDLLGLSQIFKIVNTVEEAAKAFKEQ